MAKTYGAEDLDGRLEPEANQPGHSATECMLVSIAISLKRIADAWGKDDPMRGRDPLDDEKPF